MQVDYLILADAVAVAEDKLYIHGAGWGAIYVPTLPAAHAVMGVGARLRVPWEETNQAHALEIDITVGDENGDSILSEPLRADFNLGRPANLALGSDQLLPLATTFTNIQFHESGPHTVVLRVDGHTLERSSFNVVSLQELPWARAAPT